MCASESELILSARTRLQPDTECIESWKEIARYLRRTVRTAQRWEKREGLTIHRHVHNRASSVYALKHEVDAWLESRCLDLDKGLANCSSPTRLSGKLAIATPSAADLRFSWPISIF